MENLCLKKNFLKNFIENFNIKEILDLLLLSKLTLCSNFYIMIKHTNFDYENIKESSKYNLILFDKNDNNNNEKTQIFFAKEFPEFLNIKPESLNEENAKHKFSLVKKISTKFLRLILTNRKNELFSDNISYWLLLIVFNM